MSESSDPVVHYHCANDLVRDGEFAAAIKHYKQAIALDSEHLNAEVYVFAAWLLATCSDVSLRDGHLAVEYATKACEDTDGEPWPLTALAAAYAETGDFAKAADAQKKAIELYQEYTHLEPEYRQKCRERLARYESRQTLDYDPEP